MGKNTLVQLSKPPVISDHKRCSGCGRCISACPQKLYTLEILGYRKRAVNLDPAKCACCGRCILACPLQVLSGRAL